MNIPVTIPGWEALGLLASSPSNYGGGFCFDFLDLLLTLDVTHFSLAGLVHR